LSSSSSSIIKDLKTFDLIGVKAETFELFSAVIASRILAMVKIRHVQFEHFCSVNLRQHRMKISF